LEVVFKSALGVSAKEDEAAPGQTGHASTPRLVTAQNRLATRPWPILKPSLELSLVTQPLLVPVRFHALTALMFGDLGFAAFFD